MRECLITSCLGTYKFIRAVLNRFQDVRDQKEILKMQSIEIGYILALAAASATLLGWVVMRIKSNPSERLIAYIFIFVAAAMIAVSLFQLIPTALNSGLAKLSVLRICLLSGAGAANVIWLCDGAIALVIDSASKLCS